MQDKFVFVLEHTDRLKLNKLYNALEHDLNETSVKTNNNGHILQTFT